MQRGIFIFIAGIIMTIGADAASVRGVSTASRTGTATATNQNVNPASSYTYNYMYPYLNNDMRTTLKPYDATSPSTSPINTVIRTETLSTPRRVVPRPQTQVATNNNTARVATNVANGNNNSGRRVVARRSTNNVAQGNSVARGTNVSRAQTSTFATADTGASKMVSSARCLADYTECMNRYCERENTAYNRCYCSAKLAQIDAEYQPQIETLLGQIVALQYGGQTYDSTGLNEYWASILGQYTDNPWINLDDALNIDWSTMENRVRGQNAFVTGHEYCSQHLAGCFYMASNLRDAYRSSIASDCASYEASLSRLKNAAESIIQAYQE